MLVHFYRASVQHADTWRQRLDATTNWAVVSVAAMTTFAFSQPETPHFMLLLAMVFAGFFLLMESRRFQSFSLWRHRVRVLTRYLVVPALSESLAPESDKLTAELEALAVELGSTRPHLSLFDAMGYRLRRNYLFLHGALLATWLLKLWYHPTIATDVQEYVDRAHVGLVRGEVVLGAVVVVFLLALVAASLARSEHMDGWAELPSPLMRLLGARPSVAREMSYLSDHGIRSHDEPLLPRLRDIVPLPASEEVPSDARRSQKGGAPVPAEDGESAVELTEPG